jgi:gamma-glutamyltranspeptidase/glutathione hydrolase
MPVMASRDGRLEAVAGTMGGLTHPQINAFLLIRSFILGSGSAEAVNAPRWIAGGMDGMYSLVTAEPGVPGPALDAIEDSGFRLETLETNDERVGHAQFLRIKDGRIFDVAADPRSDGSARAG